MLVRKKLCLTCILLVMVCLVTISLPLEQAGAMAGIAVSEWNIPTASSIPHGICAGPDGALWFTEGNGNKIGRITTAGVISEYGTGMTVSGFPWAICAGPDGALWFTEVGGSRIGRITTSGTITEYTGMTASGYPYDIAAGSDGALWFTESNGDKIGRITTSGTITEWGLPAGSSPYGIAAGPDGALWFAEIGRYRIGRITTSGSITEWSLPAGSGNPAGIAAGPDGALWFTEEGVNSKIGRITTSGDISEWGLSSASRDPAGIAAGPDGALWFTVRDGNKIGRVTTSGDISEWGLSSASRDPAGIAAGPDGALWFAEHNGYRIGKAVIQFTVNASVSGGHGTVTEATQTVDYSSSATIHITPDIGYHIAGITDNGAPATVADPYVINNVTADHDVEVTFALDLYTFYFAEGTCRPGFDPYICVQNPGDTAADVKITYMLGNSTTSEQTFSVNPSSRSTISVKAHLGEGDDEAHDFSAKVETVNDTRIIAERPMYFNYGGVWTGGHDVVGFTP